MNRTRLSAVLRLCALSLIWTLASCSIVPPPQELVYYQFPESRLQNTADRLDLSLKIKAVDSSDTLNTRRLLVSSDGASLNALTGVRWASPVRTLLRERLVECLRADGRIAAVTSDTVSLRTDFELHGTLRNFEADFSGEPAVYIRFDTALTNPVTRKFYGSREFRVRVVSSSTKADDLVDAFARATDQLALEIMDWSVEALSR